MARPNYIKATIPKSSYNILTNEMSSINKNIHKQPRVVLLTSISNVLNAILPVEDTF